MAEKNWEPDVTLDRYIYDYFVKRELHESAKAFMEEAKVAAEPVEIDAPGGYLYEWWSIVWDMHAARYNQKRSESAAAYLEVKERQAREHQQKIQMQQMQMLQQRNVQLLHRDPMNPSLGVPLGATNSNEMLGQPSATASVVARKIYEEHMKIPQSMGSIASTSVVDASKMALLKSANQQSQSLHVDAMGMSSDLRKMECRSQLTNGIRPEGSLNGAQRPLPMDPAFVCEQAFMQSNSGSCVALAGSNQGFPNMPLNGWPLTIQESVRSQAQLHGHNNLNNQTPIMLAHSQPHGSLGKSSTSVDTDPYKFGGGPCRSVSAKNEQSTRYDTSMFSPSQSSSPKMMNMEREQNAPSQQPDHPQQQKLQNNHNRRHPSSSGPATSTVCGNRNTSNRSPNSPSSTQTLGEGTTKPPNNPQPANSAGNMMMYRREGSPGLLSCFDHLEDINTFADMDFLDDNVESFLNNEGAQGRDGYNPQSSIQLKTDTSKDMQLPSPNI